MIVEEKTLRKIKDLGLNSYETKIWTALLSRGVSTAGEISDIANVPRSRSYDVLESLEKKGFIVMKVGKPIQYIAVPPEEVMDRVKKDIMKDAEEKVEVLKEFEESDLLGDLKELYSSGIDAVDPTEITGYVKGRDNVYDHIGMFFKNAKENVIVSADRKMLENMNDHASQGMKSANGVDVRVSCEDSLDNGFEYRNTKLEGRFVVADGEKVLFFITPSDTHPNYETAVWVESETLAKTFTQAFDNEWSPVKARLKAEVKKKVEN